MEWIKDIFPYITCIMAIAIIYAPPMKLSQSKKIEELENRIKELEKKVME